MTSPNPVHPLDPISPPDPVTPRDTPSSPSNYAAVYPHGIGPAPYNIQADPGDLTGVFSAAGNLSAGQENDIYGVGPRQDAAKAMLQSPAGYGSDGIDIQIGWHAGGGDGWSSDIEPG
jgi:hypothetical protein